METAPRNDQAWQEFRRPRITASKIGAAWTGKYGGRYNVVAEMLGLADGMVETKEKQDLYSRGHEWETPLIGMANTATGLTVKLRQAWVTHREFDAHAATIDGLLDHPDHPDEWLATIEIKTVGTHAPWNWGYWRAQCQWQMWVTGLPKCLLVVGTIDDITNTLTGFKTVWIDRDEEAQAEMVALADDILALVAAGQLPLPDEPENVDLVKHINRQADLEATADLDEIEDEVARWKGLKRAAKEAADEGKIIESRIRTEMGEAVTSTTSGGWKVTIGERALLLPAEREQKLAAEYPEFAKPIELNRAAFKKAHPKIFAEHAERIGGRRITITDLNKAKEK